MVHETDQPTLVVYTFQETTLLGSWGIERRPFRPDGECLILSRQRQDKLSKTLAVGFTFHDRNDSVSMIVVCAISCPGKTPHVTALRPPSGTFVNNSSCHGSMNSASMRLGARHTLALPAK